MRQISAIASKYNKRGKRSYVLTPAGDLAQDWINRRSGAGILNWKDFTTNADVTSWVHGDETAVRVSRNPTGGILGNGSLKFDVQAGDQTSSGLWRIPLNSTHTLVSQGVGNADTYIEFALLLGPQRLRTTIGLQVATVTGSISGNTLTVTSVSSGSLAQGYFINGASIPIGTRIIRLGTGIGGTGTYILDRTLSVGSQSINGHSPGEGFKICNIATYNPESPNSSNSNWSFEMVLHTNPGLDHIIEAYRQDGSYSPFTDGSHPAGLALQNAVDHGAGLPNDQRYSIYNINGDNTHSSGIVKFEEGVYVRFYIHFKIASPGGTTGNVFELSVQWPGDTTRTPLYSNTNFLIGAFDAPYTGGPSGLWLLPYETNRWGADYNTSHEYDQILVSNAPIPVALPLYTVPSYYTGMTPKTWRSLASNTPGDAGAVGTPGQSNYAWSCGILYPEVGEWWDFGGGHGDSSDNAIRRLPLLDANPAYNQLKAPSTPTGGTELSGVFGDGQVRSTHTHRALCRVPNSGIWLAPTPGVSTGGANSGRFHKFARNGTSTPMGYRPNTSAAGGDVGDLHIIGNAEYDKWSGKIHVCGTQNGEFWTIDPQTAVTTISDQVNSLNDLSFASAISFRRRCFAIWNPGESTMRLYNLDTNQVFTVNITNSGLMPTGAVHPGMVWHDGSNGFILWGHTSSTTNLVKLSPPTSKANTFTSNWTASTISADGSNVEVPDAVHSGANAGSVYIGLDIFENFGGLRQDLLVAQYGGAAGETYGYRLPKGGV